MRDSIELIAAIAGILSALLAVLQNFKIRRKNRKLKKVVQNIASTGVALGYFYNFLYIVFTELKGSKIKLEIYKDNSDEIELEKEFDSRNISIQIIMPKNLSIAAMDKALDFVQSHRKGDIIGQGSERNLGIYFMFDDEDNIIILDFPKPLNAIREHLLLDPSFVTKLNTEGTIAGEDIFESDGWKAAEKEELDNFKTTILSLINKGRIRSGQNRILFIEMEDS